MLSEESCSFRESMPFPHEQLASLVHLNLSRNVNKIEFWVALCEPEVILFKCMQYSHIFTNEPRQDFKLSAVFLTLHKSVIAVETDGVSRVEMSMKNFDQAAEFEDNSYLK